MENQMKNIIAFTGILFIVLIQFGCGSDDDQMDVKIIPETIEETDSVETSSFAGKVELTDMNVDEVNSLNSDSILEMVTVIEGSVKEKVKVRYRGIRDYGLGYPLYECELVDESVDALGGVAQGMSGSPVGLPGRVMGALAYGDSFSQTPQRFWVTSIEAMKASIDHRTLGQVIDDSTASAAPTAILNSTFTLVKTPMMITGIQPHRIETLSSYLRESRFNFIDLYAHISTVPRASHTFSDELGAGDMIGVAIVTGDIVNSIGFGTVTQVYDDKFVAFGHSMFNDGKVSLPVYRAVGDGIVSNLRISYKSVSVSGDPIGTITKDLTPAIVGEIGPVPDMIPINISYHPGNLKDPIKVNHEVAYGQEWAISTIAALAMDVIRMENTPGTLTCTVELEFQETNKDFSRSFKTISYDPFFDLLINVDTFISTFTNLLINSAGKATLQDVTITIVDQPQIYRAEILQVSGPTQITSGTSATFTIDLLPHWSTAGEDRTVTKMVTLNVPSSFETGGATLRVSGSSSRFGDDLFANGFFSSFDDFQEKTPEDLDDLIDQKEDEQKDLSIIKVTLETDGFGNYIEEEVKLEGFIVTGSKTKFIDIQTQ